MKPAKRSAVWIWNPLVQIIKVYPPQLELGWERGGGGLAVSVQPPVPGCPDTVLHVSATNSHLLRHARVIRWHTL
jgi:hypothetical protein